MRTKLRRTIVVLGAMVALAVSVPLAQGRRGAAAPQAGPKVPAKGAPTDVPTTLQAAADALGMLRFINRVDTVGSMEFFAKGTTAALGPTDYNGSLSYLESAMRVVMTSMPPAPGASGGATARGGRAGSQPGGAVAPTSATRGRGAALAVPKVQIEVVNGKYAWNESELGAGLVPGKGVATPAMAAVKERQLLLWTLPFGVVKAAVKAGDRTKLTKENGLAVITFPFSDELEGVTAKVTLDAKYFVTKVETQSGDAALANLNTTTTYSGYREFDIDLATTNIFFPARMVRTQGGRPVFDLRVTNTDTNNPYEVFPVPDSVR